MKIRIALTCIFFAFFGQINGQELMSTMADYADKYQEERIYIHYDKSAYAPGETIWWKAYMMEAIIPAEGSKVLYIDFSDETGKLLLHGSAPLVEGMAFGQFDLPESYKGQFLHVKAYTRWMLNFDSGFLYQKDIHILSESNAVMKKDIRADIDFFPEGGDIIEGIINKVVFKMNDQYGRPVKAKGIIQNTRGKFMDSLRILHDGMGFFFLHPEAGESYEVKWVPEGGKEQKKSLPAVMRSGVGIQIGIMGTKRNFKISSSDQSDARPLHLLGTMYKQPVFNFSRNLKDGLMQGIIPTEELPTGILTITVFDADWKPLAERITYVDNREYIFKPEITVDHWGLNKRARNELLITIPEGMSANMSISVTDAAISADTSDHIISHLMLAGELKGRVYNPAQYFKDQSDSTANKLDLVMLSHGWRRFNWNLLASGAMPEIRYPKDTTYLSVSGKIFGASPVQLRDAGNIVLLFKQDNQQNNIISVPIKSDGSFNDPSLIVFDTANIYYQLPKNKGMESATVQFMQNRLPAFSANTKASGAHSSSSADTSGYALQFRMADILNEEAKFAKAKVLETVTINRRNKSAVELLDEKYASGLFQGGDGYQFDLVNDPLAASALNIFTYLQGKVAGLQINTSSNPPSLSWRGGSPGIFLDEMQSDADMIANIPVSDVAYVKVIRPPFMGAMGGANGAIAIYTRRGADVQHSSDKGLSQNTITGYSGIRQFYSPDYSTFKEEFDKKDLRTTLYWNPEIVADPQNRQIKLSFYNNDISSSFRVVLQGMTADGRLANVIMLME